ncbi:thymidylate synthase [Candidatus Saccharibacteria bacterium]|nr:thymidylate synthase [Candidatus Saccharibacteria bacterium]
MKTFDEQYIELCRRILAEGEHIQNYKKTTDRVENYRKNDDGFSANSSMPEHTAQADSAAKTVRLPHQVLQFDLAEQFPILTSKKVAFKTAVLELLWIYQVASNDVRWLQERNVKIWNEWEIDEGGNYQGRNINEIFRTRHPSLPSDPTAGLALTEPEVDFAHTIGTAYGWIVKKYHLIDNLIHTLKTSPGNRRMVLSLWQNEWLETAALPSCVWNSQWNVTNGRLNTLVTSRSSDVPLGLPFNVVQYAVLNHLIAQVTGLKPGIFTFITNDAHIYENQTEGITEQILRYDRAVKDGTLPPPPKLWVNPEIKDFKDFDNSRELKDIKLENYENLGTIKMPVTE